MRLITLTTDFGTADWFVGTMKGVILALNPRASIVDITHHIPASDIRAGAFALAASFRYFPKHTVHVAVVDPGVGSGRKAIAVQTVNYLFVGPDNGILSFALAQEQIKAIRLLMNQELFRPDVSQTFHGRDIFAPVAARLSQGLPIQKLGPSATDFVKLAWPAPKRKGSLIEGEIVYTDRFGNAITNIDAASLAALGSPAGEVVVRDKRRCPLNTFYTAVPAGSPVALVGSCGLLEIAVNGGSAARQWDLRVGGKVVVRGGRSTRGQ